MGVLNNRLCHQGEGDGDADVDGDLMLEDKQQVTSTVVTQMVFRMPCLVVMPET